MYIEHYNKFRDHEKILWDAYEDFYIRGCEFLQDKDLGIEGKMMLSALLCDKEAFETLYKIYQEDISFACCE
jgi:hypothetical protein